MNLKHFALFRFPFEIHEETLPILNQLEEFCLCSYYHDNCISLLKQLGPAIRKLTLKFVNIELKDFEQLLKDNPNITKITHLSTESVINDALEYKENILEHKKFFHFVGNNFNELKYLEIKPEPAVNIIC